MGNITSSAGLFISTLFIVAMAFANAAPVSGNVPVEIHRDELVAALFGEFYTGLSVFSSAGTHILSSSTGLGCVMLVTVVVIQACMNLIINANISSRNITTSYSASVSRIDNSAEKDFKLLYKRQRHAVYTQSSLALSKDLSLTMSEIVDDEAAHHNKTPDLDARFPLTTREDIIMPCPCEAHDSYAKDDNSEE